uniref:Uncharacterized protein n=1 Tax=Panagrolaimus sp. JU765 TaxID=591449 RepID=A0AC34QGT4_9BILA
MESKSEIWSLSIEKTISEIESEICEKKENVDVEEAHETIMRATRSLLKTLNISRSTQEYLTGLDLRLAQSLNEKYVLIDGFRQNIEEKIHSLENRVDVPPKALEGLVGRYNVVKEKMAIQNSRQ